MSGTSLRSSLIYESIHNKIQEYDNIERPPSRLRRVIMRMGVTITVSLRLRLCSLLFTGTTFKFYREVIT